MHDSTKDRDSRTNALLEAAVDAIIAINERGIIEVFNPAAERLFGYRAAEVIGHNVSLLMPSPYREEHDAYLARYIATGIPKIIGIGREATGERKNGTTFPMELSVAEAREEERRVFVGIVRDISDRKEAERLLNESERRLREQADVLEETLAELRERSEEIKSMTQQLWQAAKLASVGELAASIAHELNNPLATISLRLESILNRTPEGDPRRPSLVIVEQETRRMSDLVANLLQFSRRDQERFSTIDVREELSKTVELVQHMLRGKQIRVIQDYHPDVPLIHADRQKLRQVFLNLLTNARDAMPPRGTLTLKVSEEKRENGSRDVGIQISDTGVGIAPEHLSVVMEPFFSTKEEGKGTGLGLAICRRIVHSHRGALSIESSLGVGTTVTIRLPVAREDREIRS